MTVGGGARFPLRTVAVAGGGFSMVAVVLLLSLNFEALKKKHFHFNPRIPHSFSKCENGVLL